MVAIDPAGRPAQRVSYLEEGGQKFVAGQVSPSEIALFWVDDSDAERRAVVAVASGQTNSGCTASAAPARQSPARTAAVCTAGNSRKRQRSPTCRPSAIRGRALRLLPGVEAALRGMGRPFRVQPTTSMQHARELAREACDAGEIVAAMGGDGIVGAVAGELRDGKGLLAVLPGGRGNDFARKLGIPFDPVEAVALIESGAETRIDLADAERSGDQRSARGRGTTYLGILSAGIDSDVSRIALKTRLKLGTFVYTYGVLRAIASWRTASWKITLDGESSTFDGYSVAVCNSGVFGGGMFLAPDARLDDGLLDVVMIARSRSPLPARPAAGVQGHAPATPGRPARPVSRNHVRGGAAVHGVRGRRPDRRAADDGARAAGGAAGGGAAMMRLAAGVAAAKAVGTLARTAGRGGGTSLPGRC